MTEVITLETFLKCTSFAKVGRVSLERVLGTKLKLWMLMSWRLVPGL